MGSLPTAQQLGFAVLVNKVERLDFRVCGVQTVWPSVSNLLWRGLGYRLEIHA